MVAAGERVDTAHGVASHCLPWPLLLRLHARHEQGDYVEVDGQLAIHHYASLNFTNPVYEIHATEIRRLETPMVGVIEKYDG